MTRAIASVNSAGSIGLAMCIRKPVASARERSIVGLRVNQFESFQPARHFDDECRAPPILAVVSTHAAVVQLDDVMHDRKAQPEAAMATRFFRLMEWFEHMRQQIGTDPRSRVADRNPHR
jgi:hypothetical protein